jgi:hypothetical protein
VKRSSRTFHFKYSFDINTPYVPEADFSHQSRQKIANCDIGDRQRDPWLSDASSKSFSFASVATATQIILATLPLYSQNATWRYYMLQANQRIIEFLL